MQLFDFVFFLEIRVIRVLDRMFDKIGIMAIPNSFIPYSIFGLILLGVIQEKNWIITC